MKKLSLILIALLVATTMIFTASCDAIGGGAGGNNDPTEPTEANGNDDPTDPTDADDTDPTEPTEANGDDVIDTTQPATEPTTDGNETDNQTGTTGNANFTRGSWNGNVYSNNALGVTFTAPEGWHIFSDTELAEAMNLAPALLGDNFADLWEDGAIDVIMEMQAMSMTSFNSVNVVVTNERGLVINMARMIEEMADEVIGAMPGTSNLEIHSGTTRIGGFDYHSFSYEIDLGFGMIMHTTQFLYATNGLQVVITVGLFDTEVESVDQIVAMFGNL